jgi:ribose transport system substrate-binding protein
MFKSRNRLFVLLLILVAAIVLVACGGGAQTQAPAEEQPAEAPAGEETQQPAEEQPAEAPAEAMGPFTIGVSNSFVGSEYRTQMIQILEDVNSEYMDAGLTTELVIESETTDVAGQIQQIQNLMNQGVDAIIINPGDVEGLNATLEEAVASGIVVIAIDQEIGADGVINVAINQKEWAMTSAEWFAEELGGEGDVVLIEGFVGHPANVARMEGVEEVFANYPGINVVGRESGMWDEATGQQVMSDFLAALPNIDGYWTQDGMAIGALQAVIAANPAQYPVLVGEGRVQFLNLWKQVLDENPDFRTIAVANPPGVAGSGLRIALNILQGKEIDASKFEGPYGNTLYMPIPVVVTNDNFQEVYDEYKNFPESYLLDGILSEDEIQGYFK